MNKSFSKFISLVFLLIIIGSNAVFAQENIAVTELQPVITSTDSVEIDKNIIFDASKTLSPDANKNLTFKWDFGDGNKDEGGEVVHNYTSSGPKTISLTVNDGEKTSVSTKEIFVYKKIIIFITDRSDLKERIAGFKNFARERDINIMLIESYESATDFISEEILKRKLIESIDDLKKLDKIIVWTDGNSGLNALSWVKQQQTETNEPISFDTKSILFLADSGQGASQIYRQYDLLKPENIIVAKEAAIYPFIESSDSSKFIERLKTDGYDFSLINEQTGQLQIWNFVSYFVNYLIDSGIPANTVILILMLPVIATIVAFMKQIIGITTFGIYTPSIITLTFWILGLKVGLLTLLIVFLVGTGSRYALKKLSLLYIPKMAIVLTMVALAIFAMLIISIKFNLFDAEFFALSIFPMLILSTLTEKFINVQTEEGFKKAIVLTLETVFVAIVAYIVIGGEVDLLFLKMKFSSLQSFMLSYPEIILLIIFINILLGRWTGLRLVERIRFREVLRHVEEE